MVSGAHARRSAGFRCVSTKCPGNGTWLPARRKGLRGALCPTKSLINNVNNHPAFSQEPVGGPICCAAPGRSGDAQRGVGKPASGYCDCRVCNNLKSDAFLFLRMRCLQDCCCSSLKIKHSCIELVSSCLCRRFAWSPNHTDKY